MNNISKTGLFLTLIALVVFTYLTYQMFHSVLIALVTGPIITLMACRPARSGGPCLWQKMGYEEWEKHDNDN